MQRLLLLAIVIIAAAAAGWQYWERDDNGGGPGYRLAKVEKGAVLMTVSSTGKVNPVTTVQVGSQVSGQIYKLEADFNTPVKAGQVIARIDPASFDARVSAARADLAFARANVKMQKASLADVEADIKGAQAALKDAEQDLARKKALLDRRVVSAAVVDRAQSLSDQSAARLDSARAKLLKQQAQVETAQAQTQARLASLHERQLDLDRAIIRSPVDGIVINRNVDLGQTVAASLQAPVLFTIAEDLARMQVEVSVDEADIGRVRVAQRVKFTVDAYATREFTGEVLQIRKSPREVSNVVTYMVIVDSANPDLALLPGMTANVEIVIGERKDVLKVPDAALRFTPPSAAAESDTKSAGPGGGREAAIARMRALMKNLVERLKLNDAQQSAVRAIFMETGQAIGALRQGGGDPEQLKPMIKSMRDQAATRIAALLDDGQRKIYAGMRAAAAAAAEVRRGRVWILDAEGKPEAVPLRIGISDGSMSQILTKKLGVGVEVIVSKASAAARK